MGAVSHGAARIHQVLAGTGFEEKITRAVGGSGTSRSEIFEILIARRRFVNKRRRLSRIKKY
jgi:hypothetical protein